MGHDQGKELSKDAAETHKRPRPRSLGRESGSWSIRGGRGPRYECVVGAARTVCEVELASVTVQNNSSKMLMGTNTS